MKYILPLILLLGSQAADAREYDLILRGGTVVDGTGATRRTADVGVIGDSIAAVGNLTGSTAKREIDVKGRIVTPGFIDMHAHVAENDFGAKGLLSPDTRRRAAQNYILQGVTSAAANPDGDQPPSLVEQRAALVRAGIGINVALFNGHNALRARTMGKDQSREATPDEIRAMQDILRRGLAQEGSFGLSLGLEYDSGRYSNTSELVELARVLSEYGGIYTAHLRSQGSAPMWYKPSRDRGITPPTLEQSLEESVRVAEETGATVVVTHIKAWGPGIRGHAARYIAQLQAARDRGARVFIDLYPLTSAGSDGDFVMLPAWSIGGAFTTYAGFDRKKRHDYAATLRKTLRDPSQRADVVSDVTNQVGLKGGPENIVVLEYKDRRYVGRTLAELMEMRREDLGTLAVSLQTEGDRYTPGGVKLRAVSMDQRDLDAFYSQPWTATSTDGWIVLPEEAVGPLKYVETNPRNFNTYPRRIAYISQKRNVDSLEEAVRKSTSLPAHILNLPDRGTLATGMKADIAVIDLARLRDNATVEEPSVYPDGVEQVFVNGVAVVTDGKPTLALPGRVLDPAGRPASGSPPVEVR